MIEDTKAVKLAVKIADQVVPQYRLMGKSYSCTGVYAKRWQAAYDGAEKAIRRMMED